MYETRYAERARVIVSAARVYFPRPVRRHCRRRRPRSVWSCTSCTYSWRLVLRRFRGTPQFSSAHKYRGLLSFLTIVCIVSGRLTRPFSCYSPHTLVRTRYLLIDEWIRLNPSTRAQWELGDGKGLAQMPTVYRRRRRIRSLRSWLFTMNNRYCLRSFSKSNLTCFWRVFSLRVNQRVSKSKVLVNNIYIR